MYNCLTCIFQYTVRQECIQGLGAPACAKLITQWYSSSERGTAWSIWTASNNVGGFATPWIAGGAAGALGWRWGMWTPACIALGVSAVILFSITDKPMDKGYPPAEASAQKLEASERAGKDGSSSSSSDEKPTVKDILFKDVLPNPFVWLFAVSYFFVCVLNTVAPPLCPTL
jgi:MFS transporter, OPA family, sugar phosphate sensor protein UhpC